jgi:small subunit ribosomal protein S4
MSRYTGPSFKKARRYGFSILENEKEFNKGKKRTIPTTYKNGRVPKQSNYGLHLYEKQKVKFMYGLSEKQFKTTFKKATKLKGASGPNFLNLLETRLDNIVFRTGMVNTRRASRQLVTHGHVLVDGRKADIASMQITVGQTIAFKDKILKNEHIIKQAEGASIHKKDFLTFDKKTLKGKLERLPNRDELNPNINEALIVEFYNK